MATADPISTPMTYAELQAQAAQQASAEISGQNAPLLAQESTLASQRAAASAALEKMYGSLMPYVQSSADRVADASKAALAMEHSIFEAAGTRMNQLHQQQAADAQKLAQEMGGPVATSEFTAGLQPYEAQFPAAEASTLLHGLGIAEANMYEAEQFAGQVFPALRTEQQARSDSFFNDQIKTLDAQITQNNAAKSVLTGSKLSELLAAERSFELNTKQYRLSKLQAERDWKATKAQLKADSVRLGLSKKASALSEAGVTGKYKGKPTMEARRLTAQQKMEAARLGLSAAEFRTRLAQATEKQGTARKKQRADDTSNAMEIIDNAMNPNGGRPITMTTKQYIKKGSMAETRAELGKISDAHYDPKRKQWYTYERLTLSAKDWAKQGGYTGATPVSDPDRLYALVRGAVPGLPKAVVINLVRAKTGQANWSPGKKSSYSGAELHNLTLDELQAIARDRGYKPQMGHRNRRATKQTFIDWILHHNPR